MTKQQIEQKAIKVSIGGTLFMALLGIIFAYLTDSEAILIDGLFSLVSFTMGLFTLRVAKLLNLPDDEHFQFGYASFEPLLNLSKGLLIAFISLFALYSATSAIIGGGRPIETGLAIYYALIAATGCFGTALYLRKMYKQSDSSMVQVDYNNWIIDGLISSGVAVAFIFVYLFQNQLAEYLAFVDPVIVILLILSTLHIPWQIIRENSRELLFAAPVKKVSHQIKEQVRKHLHFITADQLYLRMAKVGRAYYLNIHIITQQQTDLENSSRQDQIREDLYRSLHTTYPDLVVDLIFTREKKWAHEFGQHVKA
ncbi:cation diffusion facilitator family transporter [Rapidithrix thailandica]|uniref:Cation diffusion facilitator family transporter n=1 Tax=Rapidithrix thailandica TaxID=413964 RepID=A0AAW9SCP7_9BACT